MIVQCNYSRGRLPLSPLSRRFPPHDKGDFFISSMTTRTPNGPHDLTRPGDRGSKPEPPKIPSSTIRVKFSTSSLLGVVSDEDETDKTKPRSRAVVLSGASLCWMYLEQHRTGQVSGIVHGLEFIFSGAREGGWLCHSSRKQPCRFASV